MGIVAVNDQPHGPSADDRGLRLAVSGWYAGHPAGTGQYTDALVVALAETADTGDSIRIVAPPHGSGSANKLLYEQYHFPRESSRFDVAHVPYWAPPANPKVPTVVTIHDLIPMVLPAYRRSLSMRAYVRLVARTTSSASAIIADSSHTADDIARHLQVPPELIHTIPLAVDARYNPDKDTDGPAGATTLPELPERFGLYLGGFDVRKNIATLATVWRSVFDTTGVPLVLAGRLPDRGDALAPHPADLAREAELPDDALVLIGHVEELDKPELYRRAAVFVYPSMYEGFGLPPLEAMACGTPAVVSNAASLPEIVGDGAVLVAPGDVAGWVQAVSELLSDAVRSQALATAGIGRASQYTWRRTAQLTREVYRSVKGSF